MQYLQSGDFTLWKAQASSFALFSDDPNDIYPIAKAQSLCEANTANKDGIYLVGGKTVQVKTYRDHAHYLSDEGKGYHSYTIQEDELRSNNALARTSNRQARLEIRLDKNNYAVLLRFSAQRKSGFIIRWWDRYSTTVGARIRITELSHPFHVYKAAGNYSMICRLLRGATQTEHAPFTLRRSIEGEHRINLSTHELREEVLPFGRFELTSDVNDDEFNTPCIMRGYMEVWSRGVPQHQSGKSNIDITISL